MTTRQITEGVGNLYLDPYDPRRRLPPLGSPPPAAGFFGAEGTAAAAAESKFGSKLHAARPPRSAFDYPPSPLEPGQGSPCSFKRSPSPAGPPLFPAAPGSGRLPNNATRAYSPSPSPPATPLPAHAGTWARPGLNHYNLAPVGALEAKPVAAIPAAPGRGLNHFALAPVAAPEEGLAAVIRAAAPGRGLNHFALASVAASEMDTAAGATAAFAGPEAPDGALADAAAQVDLSGCYFCGEAGHKFRHCPIRNHAKQLQRLAQPPSPSPTPGPGRDPRSRGRALGRGSLPRGARQRRGHPYVMNVYNIYYPQSS